LPLNGLPPARLPVSRPYADAGCRRPGL